MFSKFVNIVFIVFFSLTSYGQLAGMALIEGGNYIPLYGSDSMPVKVEDFHMDQYPVTNAEFVKFLEENPKWQKSNVIALFADGNYMRHFQNDTELKEGELPNAPMTNVSWFAAKKYCECQGKRLPTLDEWEYVGMASENRADARTKDEYNKFILSWYEKPNSYNQEIGSTFKNYWGIYDMHGLVWEWTQDFNSVLISGESRKDVDGSNDLFCGGAAVGSSDLMNYAAFMRYAFRGSIKANYSVRNLGFRCAKSLDKPNQ